MDPEKDSDLKGRDLSSNITWHTTEAKKPNHDWTSIEDRKQRKKNQNRLNQRAHSKYTALREAYCVLSSINLVN